MHGNLVAAPAAAAKDKAGASGGFTGSARIPQFRFCDAVTMFVRNAIT